MYQVSKNTWKTYYIGINIVDNADLVMSSKTISYTRDQFFNDVVKKLDALGYVPRLNIELMRKAFKSPYSESEYFTFIKMTDEVKIKVILDIRFAEHELKEWGNHSAVDRHLYNMEVEKAPEIAAEFGADVSKSEFEFIDVRNQKVFNNDIIEIDDKLFNNYSDAYKYMETRLDALP